MEPVRYRFKVIMDKNTVVAIRNMRFFARKSLRKIAACFGYGMQTINYWINKTDDEIDSKTNWRSRGEELKLRQYQPYKNGKKLCTACTEYKPVERFSKNKDRKDGREGQCKDCRAIYSQNNSKKLTERASNWNRQHPEIGIAHTHKRRALMMGSDKSFTAQEWKALKEFYKFTCLRCGKKEPEIKLTPDHVLPLVKGGSNGIDNIQPLCKPCNSRKQARHIDYRPTYQAVKHGEGL